MFEDPFGSGTQTDELIKSLEAQLPMLPEDDQGFVIGCRMNLDSGMGVDKASEARLRRLQSQTTAIGHDALEKPLSPVGKLKALAAVRHTLSAEEMRFANAMATKIQQKTPLTTAEIEQILNLADAKGV